MKGKGAQAEELCDRIVWILCGGDTSEGPGRRTRTPVPTPSQERTVKPLILFLEQQSTRGGAQRVLDEVLLALEGEYLPLVAFPGDGPFAADLRRRNIETLVYPLGHYQSGPKSLPDILAFPLRSSYCGLQLARTITRRQVRLVYINGPRCLLAGVLATRLTGRPSLFHLHLTVTRRMDRLVAGRLARYTTRIIACSQTTANALADTMRVIYNPVPKPASEDPSSTGGVDPGQSYSPSAPWVVGMVGRITPQKGQHVLVGAAGQLVGKGHDLKLIFVGAPGQDSRQDDAYLRELEISVRRLGLEGRVRWAGYQKDPNPYYELFDILVIPSTVSEGLPMVALEALRWGVPVVGSRLGGIPEVVKEGVNGCLVPSGDERALAEGLERVLGDSQLRTQLQLGARASVDGRFSMETFCAVMRQTVSELCQRV